MQPWDLEKYNKQAEKNPDRKRNVLIVLLVVKRLTFKSPLYALTRFQILCFFIFTPDWASRAYHHPNGGLNYLGL